MQETLVFNHKECNSTIHFLKETAVPPLPSSGGLYVCDTNMNPILAPYLPPENLIVLQAGESYKTLDSVCLILDRATELGLSRDSLFVGIGGGVITDMTAFAASLYMRGAALALVPTTLLAMCDAAVGGKTGVDYKTYKNYAGTFYPASDIYICTSFLETLPRHEFICGMGEVIKTAVLFDFDFFELIDNNRSQILSMASPGAVKDHYLLMKIIYTSVRHKCRIIEQDATESNTRMLLNLGHTFAHALETFCGLGCISHGAAVAWGIGRAAELAVREKVTDRSTADAIQLTVDSWGWSGTQNPPELTATATARGLSEQEMAAELIAIMGSDKKKRNDTVQFVLPTRIGYAVIRPVAEKNIVTAIIGTTNGIKK